MTEEDVMELREILEREGGLDFDTAKKVALVLDDHEYSSSSGEFDARYWEGFDVGYEQSHREGRGIR